MTGPSGIGGSSPTPEEIPGMGQTEGLSSTNLGDLMHTKVSTLAELKAVLIEYMGEKEGTKFYNKFMESFALLMLTQVQQSAQQAQQAAQNMRMNTT